MRNARTVKREPAVEPTPLELIEIAQGIPFNQNELTLAWASLAHTKETAKVYERIADLLSDQLTVARLYWQIAHEICATPVSFPADAPNYCPPELERWFQLDCDNSERIPGSKAAQFLGWTRPTFLKAWDTFFPFWKFRESKSYSASLLRRLGAYRIEAERKRKADQAKARRARKKESARKK
jgi:hypothetical protein